MIFIITVKEKVCSFDSLYKAMKKCKKNVMWKDSVQGYYKNALVNIHELRKSLLDGKYKIDKYTEFKIFEPKERNIVATRLKDRVFQRSLCDNYVYEAITKSFIYDNCACRKNKGTEFGRKRMKAHLQRFYRKHKTQGYILKLDIKNYFGSTPHAIAKAAVAKRVKDEWACSEVFKVIDSYKGDKGLGLGSELTQLIQLAVLDDLDHYIKEQLKIKHYIRYMDDMILIHHSKSYLKKCLEKIEERLEALGLKVNIKKTQIFPVKQGVKFLGFKYKLTDSGKVAMTLLKQKGNREKRKLKRLVKRSQNGKMTRLQVDRCFEGFIAYIGNSKRHVKRCCFKLTNKFKSYYKGLWGASVTCQRFTKSLIWIKRKCPWGT